MPHLFRSKLLLPALDDATERPRLLDGSRSRLLIAQAPPGAGKTIFLTQWAAALGRPTVYYALDEQDLDPQVFTAHVLTGFRSVWPDWQPPAEAAASPAVLAVELVNEASVQPPVTLVLDRLETVFGCSYLADLLAVLVRYAPPGLSLGLGSRSPLPGDPGVPGRQSRVVTACDLAMTESEATAWLGDGDWRECFRISGGLPLALAFWRQAGSGWREALEAHLLAAVPPHVTPAAARALVADWIAGGMNLDEFSRQISSGQPGAEALWQEAREIRELLLNGDFQQAMAALAPLWEKARAGGDRPLIGAVALLRGEYHYSKGEYGLAMDWYRQAFLADPLLETVGTHSMVAILKDQGHEQEAEQLAVRCLAARQSRGDLQALAYAHAQYGSLLSGLERFDEAEHHLAEGERLGLKLSGEPFYGILAMAFRAVLRSYQGNAAAYRQLAEQAYSHAKLRSRWLEAICGYILAFSLLQWGEVEQAQRFLGKSLAYLTEIDSKWQRHMVLTYIARGLWSRGLQEQARSHFDTALELAARESYLQFLSGRRTDTVPLVIDALLRGVEVPLCQEVLVRMGQRAEPALLELAASKNPDARRAALYPLARIGSEQAVTALRHLLYDADDQVVNAAMMALRSIEEAPSARGPAHSPDMATPVSIPSPASPSAAPAAAGDAASLKVDVLGPVRVQVCGAAVQTWRTVKARDLLAYLVLSGERPVTRDQLLEALWPEADFEPAQASLHTTLYHLRRTLKPAGENLIAFAGGAYRLEREGVLTDLQQFEQLAATGGEAAWKAAAGLYRGELLEGLDYPWCEAPRVNARTTYLRVLRSLAAHLRSEGRTTEAIDWLQRLVQVDPLAEEGHIGLMECFSTIGNRNSALQQYRTMARLLDDELGLEPSQEAQRVYQRLLE